ncbi:hypothetical protein [Absidia glauca]|uniref:Uncharacterized protein n=1 Tax=Absidia glauca TaxID=4829 RepID=A0A168SRL0_ABSGL|nr:hypothetical protein [Absidia glauca]
MIIVPARSPSASHIYYHCLLHKGLFDGMIIEERLCNDHQWNPETYPESPFGLERVDLERLGLEAQQPMVWKE